MSGGPAQRAMPGSLYPVLTQLESQRRLQLQYRGLAPMALRGEEGQNCTCCPGQGTGLRDLVTGQDLVTWLGCHVMGGPGAPPFADAVGGLGCALSPAPLPRQTTLLPAPQPTQCPVAPCWGSPLAACTEIPLQHSGKAAWAQCKLGKAP